MESDEYEVTDSEDEYSKDDKVLLEYARKSMKKRDVSSDEEVYGFERSDSDEENEYEVDEEEEDDDEEDEKEGSNVDMESDLEDERKLPDERAWGKKKKSFYSTDFVDQDYEGVYQGDEAEIAELEEQEAKNIQKRLIEQLTDADFSIIDAIGSAENAELAAKEIIETDFSKLSKRQKLDIFKKESPEFFVLVQDFKDKLESAQKIMTVINYFKGRIKQSFPLLEFLQTKFTIILNYCTNISYYLFLKAKRIPVKNHPCLKSLFRYRQLLQEMEDVDTKIVEPQLDNVLKMIKAGKEIPLDEELVIKKKTLKLLSDKQKQREIERANKNLLPKENSEEEIDEEKIEYQEDKLESIEPAEENDEEEKANNLNEKRAITYEMAKNKGLTPKRRKELRNPRVKNRKKYEKARIRRKGQVRTPRTEIPVYGGEASGIKIGLTKSIKFK